MDIRQLRYFTVIIECGSLSKASRQLYIAQPALSQQIAKLEDEVGKPLLTRSPRGVEPTENGLALYHHARFMLRQFDQALTIARKETADVQGVVSLGVAATTGQAIALPLLKRARERYPNILLNIVEGMSGHLGHMLQMRQLDMAILFAADAIRDLDSIPLLEEDLFVLLHEDSKLVPHDVHTLTLEDVSQLPLILPTSFHGLRRRIAAEFERRNLLVQVVAEIDSLSIVMDCVREGLGATIKPYSALGVVADLRQWRVFPISDAPISRKNYLYTAPAITMSPAATLIADIVQETVRSLIESGEWQAARLV
jgi:LysR family tcuABC transcriptional regulator